MTPESELPNHISQQIDTVAALHERDDSGVSLHQRTIEKVTANLGRPLFLNLILIAIAVWVGMNLIPQEIGWKQPVDTPPFFWMQGFNGLVALLLTVLVLITQNRQARLAERRAELDLQVNLLAEQKIAKLIALVEELRRDLPSVRNRVDLEAEAMSEATDAEAVLDALEEKLEEKLEEASEIVEEAAEIVDEAVELVDKAREKVE